MRSRAKTPDVLDTTAFACVSRMVRCNEPSVCSTERSLHRDAMFDCQRCGACCRNPDENRAQGFFDWVEVDPKAPLLRRHKLATKLVTRGSDGRPHLRLDEQGRCVALRGTLGSHVRCDIYPLRPRACRRVQAGDPSCLAYRAELGLET